MLSQAMWWTAAVVMSGYILLFVLARRRVSLRLARVGRRLETRAAQELRHTFRVDRVL